MHRCSPPSWRITRCMAHVALVATRAPILCGKGAVLALSAPAWMGSPLAGAAKGTWHTAARHQLTLQYSQSGAALALQQGGIRARRQQLTPGWVRHPCQRHSSCCRRQACRAPAGVCREQQSNERGAFPTHPSRVLLSRLLAWALDMLLERLLVWQRGVQGRLAAMQAEHQQPASPLRCAAMRRAHCQEGFILLLAPYPLACP